MLKTLSFYSGLLFSHLNLLVAEETATIPATAKVEILSPAFSQRKTAKLRLSNGLEVFLISDPKAIQSGAALSVEAGSWNDPQEYPGMAHFLEHMLFMGTKAYPNENDYSQYMASHGGMRNAYTLPDRTVYMFSIEHASFEGGVDRFSHFFIDPLFSKNSISKELHAVDQEHAKNIENDAYRIHMVFKETGNPKHPNVQFSTGNAKTLAGIPQDAMISWYKKYYSADRMHLVMISNQSIEAMEALAAKHFSEIPISSYKVMLPHQPLLSSKQKGSMLIIRPIKDLKLLSLLWEIPTSLLTDYKTQIPRLFAYILGSEDPNGLSAQLKKAHLAESLQVDVDRYSKTQGIFCIDVILTEEGLEQKDRVIELCYSMIHLLAEKKNFEPYFSELRQQALNDYQYPTREDVFEQMMQYAHNMVDEPLESFPLSGQVPEHYDAEKAEGFLKTLTPENASIFVTTPSLQAPLTHKEKWIGVNYEVTPFAKETLNQLALLPPDPSLKMPSFNPYIASDFHLIEASHKEIKTPELLANDTLCTLYYKPDSLYEMPQTSITLGMQSPKLDGSARSKVLFSLYRKALLDLLLPDIDAATSAGLFTDLGLQNLKFMITIQGFSDKSLALFKKVVSQLQNVTISKEQFEHYKLSIASSLRDMSKEMPIRQAFETLNSVLVNDAPVATEQLAALDPISYEDFVSFEKSLFESIHIEGFIYGNLTHTQAKEIHKEIKHTFAHEPASVTLQPKRKVMLFPSKEGPFRIDQPTLMQGHSTLLCLQLGALSCEARAYHQILTMALEEMFFDALRTKQQTGYIAHTVDKEIEKQLFLFFGVQSNTHTPDELLARFELFLEDFVRNFSERLPKEHFEEIKASLISNLSQPPENLFQMASRLYNLAFNYKADFEWMEKRLEAAKQVTYEGIKAYAEASLSRKNKKRIAIIVQGRLPEESHFAYESITPQELIETGFYICSE